jgi:glutaredoxin
MITVSLDRRCKLHVKVYGADWCKDTQQTLSHLSTLGVEFEYINIENNQKALAWVESQNNGKKRMPTVEIAGQVLTVPDNKEVDSALREKGLMA